MTVKCQRGSVFLPTTRWGYDECLTEQPWPLRLCNRCVCVCVCVSVHICVRDRLAKGENVCGHPHHSCSHICISRACCFSLHRSYAQAPTPQTIPPTLPPPIEKTLTLGWLIQPLLTGSQTTQCSDGGGGGGGWRRGKLREGDTLMSMPELSRSTRNNTNSQLRDTPVLRPLTQHTHAHAHTHTHTHTHGETPSEEFYSFLFVMNTR